MQGKVDVQERDIVISFDFLIIIKKQIVDLEFFNKFLSEVNYRLFEKFIVQDVIIKGKKVINI